MKNNALIFSLVISFFGLLAFGPKQEGIEKLVASLQRWSEANPHEKIHLHLDKPYYAVGDTIWFKAYVTIGSRHQLSAMSGALYVELLDGRDSLIRDLKLPVVSGTTVGDFTLDEQLSAGTYRIRAFTQWMRNAGEDYFYDRTFLVGSVTSSTPPAASSSSVEYDVQFFPESGNLVDGIASRIGFKAIGADGIGVSAKGVILDDLDNEIVDFESLYAGMGSVTLKPAADRSYRAKIVFADRSEKIVKLPTVMDNGYVLSVYKPVRDSILIRINASRAAAENQEVVNLIVQAGGETIYAAPFKINRSIRSIWLHKALFPTGIAQFTLLNTKDEPLNERIAFIKTNDHMELAVTSGKKTYRSREPVNLTVTATNSEGTSTAGNFSVSVIDESKVPFDDNLGYTIFSNLLLSAELKGSVENPNYYFSKETDEVNDALDNLMLTQGYRKFDWKAIAADSLAKPIFPAEGIGNVFSGKVLGLNGKPQPNATVTMMALKANLVQSSTADMEGRFKFGELVLTDSIRMTLQAKSEKNNTRVELILDSIPRIKSPQSRKQVSRDTSLTSALKIYTDNIIKLDKTYESTGQFDRVRRLKEVNITAAKKQQKYTAQGMLSVPQGHADLTIEMKDEKAIASMESFIRQKIAGRGVRFQSFKPDKFGPEVMFYPWANDPIKNVLAPMTIIVDGRKLDQTDAVDVFNNATLEPADIAKIEVVVTNMGLVSMLGGPSIMFYTKADRFVRKPEPNVINLSPRGYNKVKSFYHPKYERASIDQMPDLRSTIYWNPNVKTYATGKTSLNYFNADGPGSYKLIIEGINEDGELGRAVYRYNVDVADPQSNVQVVLPAVTNLIGALDILRNRLPIEKLYLHTDKSYYNLGDTLWFKSYLMNGPELSGVNSSNFLYVELLNDSADVVRQIKIPVSKGLGWAQIPLPRKIFHEGAYTLRAYTNWMQNFGSDYFFSKRFYLGVPTPDVWLVKANSKISKENNKEYLVAEIALSRSDLSPAGLRDIEVRLMEGARERAKEKMQTTPEGRLSLRYELKDKWDGRNIRLLIKSSYENDGNQSLVVPLNILRDEQIDLQFLPEGGHMVAGLKSVVAFKAIGEDGKGIAVAGQIVNAKGLKIAEFASLHNGMGSFEFTPSPGEVYSAQLAIEGGQKKYALPNVQPRGTVMTVINSEDSDSIKVIIAASSNIITSSSTWYLAAMSSGRVTYFQSVTDKKFTHHIAKSQLPSGVSRLTLLQNRMPVNERLVFVNHNDQLQISVRQNKPTYWKRDSIALEVMVTDKNGQPVKGHFSLAVTDDSQIRPDSIGNANITTDLLLTSDLKGLIENPGFYFNNTDLKRTEALDNLLLTHGWTGYNWTDAFKLPAKPAFERELRFKVKGIVTNLVGKPVEGAQMVLSSQRPTFLTGTLTDANGQYLFEDLPQIDSPSLFIQAKTPAGKTMNFGGVTVERFKAPSINTNYRDQQLPWYVNVDPVQLNYVRNLLETGDELRLTNSGIALKEVKIESKKIIKGSYKLMTPPDLVFDEQDIKESAAISLYQLLRQKLPGFRLTSEDGLPTAKFNKYMLEVFADGNPIPIRMNAALKFEDLQTELASTMIANFVGMEIYYSKRYRYNEQRKYEYGKNGVRRGIGNISVHKVGNGYNKLKAEGSDYYLADRAFLAKTASNNPHEFAVIHITTKFSSGGFYNNRPDYVTLRPLPLMHPAEFYSPKYGASMSTSQAPDYRATVYWMPEFTTNSNGKAELFFYSADIPGNYTLNFQGTDMNGSIGSHSTKLKVITQAK